MVNMLKKMKYVFLIELLIALELAQVLVCSLLGKAGIKSGIDVCRRIMRGG